MFLTLLFSCLSICPTLGIHACHIFCLWYSWFTNFNNNNKKYKHLCFSEIQFMLTLNLLNTRCRGFLVLQIDYLWNKHEENHNNSLNHYQIKNMNYKNYNFLKYIYSISPIYQNFMKQPKVQHHLF